MKNVLLTLILACCVSLYTNAQQILFEHSFGCDLFDAFRGCAFTYDSTRVVAVGGSRSSCGDVPGHHGGGDAWICEIDLATGVVWKKNYGSSVFDEFTGIIQNQNGGYTCFGQTVPFDWLIMEVDNLGDSVWKKTYGGSGTEYCNGMVPTEDKGYIVAGYTSSTDGDISHLKGVADIWVVRLDSVGNIVWEKTYGGSETDGAESIVRTFDGNYLIGGWSGSADGDRNFNYGITDAWLIKIDGQGNLLWQKSYGGSSVETAAKIVQTSDSGFVVAGWSKSDDIDLSQNSGEEDVWIFKIDQTGNLQWQKSFGGSNTDEAEAVACSKEGGYMIVATTESNDGDVVGHHGATDIWAIKLTDSGTLEWQRPIGGWDYESGTTGLLQSSDSAYILVSSSGFPDGDISTDLGDRDGWLVKLATLSTNIENPFPAGELTFNIYPNPARTSVVIQGISGTAKAVLYAVTGSIVREVYLLPDNSLSIEGLDSGLYYLQIQTEEGSGVKPIFIL